MGVDLTLHVVSGEKPHMYCATRLDMAKDYDLWDAIESAPRLSVATELGKVWGFFGDDNAPIEDSDPYGNPYQFTTAGELCQATSGFVDMTDRNRAAFAYLRVIPALTPVILGWH